MAEIKTGKKRLPINMSFLTHTDSIKTSAQKSPRNFEQPSGVVGLGILVAMNDDRHRSSNPVPILSTRSFSKKLDLEKMEMCEEYTCVVFRVGDNLITRKEYFEAGILWNDDHGDHKVFASVVTGNSGVSDFLNSCFLCDKMLHGLDIFMYRGEKAFCSAECRYRQISMDERNEKCYSKARKPMEYSVSPCSGALQFLTGVAAAVNWLNSTNVDT